jgi:transposase
MRKAPERLAGLRTPGLPANIIEEFRRDVARLLVREQNSSIEKTRAERLERA